MEVQINEIVFDRDESGKVLYTDENLEKLVKYVVPVIEKNRGWSTEELTLEKFMEDPSEWRDEIDQTVEKYPSSKVHVAVNGKDAVGLIVYVATGFESAESEFTEVLEEMVSNRDSDYWSKLHSYVKYDSELLDQHFKSLQKYIFSRTFYRRVGIVVRTDLQGQETGVSDQLYRVMDNGFVFGRTSTPFAVAKRRKVFPESLMFPVSPHEISTLGTFACLTVVAARTFSLHPDSTERYSFGVITHSTFPVRDKKKYTELNRSFLGRDKISEEDFNSFEQILNYKKAQAAIISLTI
jgi:hypothetical protein